MTLLGETEDAKLLEIARAIPAVDCLLRPRIDVGVPQRAVVGRDRRDAAEDVKWARTVFDCTNEPLALRVVLAGRSVRGDLTWNMVLESGGLVVSKEITLDFHVELVRQSDR